LKIEDVASGRFFLNYVELHTERNLPGKPQKFLSLWWILSVAEKQKKISPDDHDFPEAVRTIEQRMILLRLKVGRVCNAAIIKQAGNGKS
jgi:hypothetical protein